jgi:hypothetical protein
MDINTLNSLLNILVVITLIWLMFCLKSRTEQLKIAVQQNQELQKMCDHLFNDPAELALPLYNKQWILVDANNVTLAECHSTEYAEELVKAANRFMLK